MNVASTYYQVRAFYWDYETAEHVLRRNFSVLEHAQKFEDTINNHIAFAGGKNTAHPSLRVIQQNLEDGESDEAFALRENAWRARLEQHHEEELAWFDSGHGYFLSKPIVFEITEKPI